MTIKDKLEIGLKDDAPFRKDNLPPMQQQPGVPAVKPGDPTRSPEVPGARQEAARQAGPSERPRKVARKTVKSRTSTPARKPATKVVARGRRGR